MSGTALPLLISLDSRPIIRFKPLDPVTPTGNTILPETKLAGEHLSLPLKTKQIKSICSEIVAQLSSPDRNLSHGGHPKATLNRIVCYQCADCDRCNRLAYGVPSNSSVGTVCSSSGCRNGRESEFRTRHYICQDHSVRLASCSIAALMRKAISHTHGNGASVSSSSQ